MSDPVLCPACRHELRFVKSLGTRENPTPPGTGIDRWMCLGCMSIWAVETIQKHLEETEHPLKDTVSG